MRSDGTAAPAASVHGWSFDDAKYLAGGTTRSSRTVRVEISASRPRRRPSPRHLHAAAARLRTVRAANVRRRLARLEGALPGHDDLQHDSHQPHLHLGGALRVGSAQQRGRVGVPARRSLSYVHVPAAALLVSTESPRPSRGIAATRLHGIIHAPAAASPRPSADYPRRGSTARRHTARWRRIPPGSCHPRARRKEWSRRGSAS